MHTLTLKAGREKSLLRHHPWVFSGAIAALSGDPASGESVLVEAADGTALGCGAWSPKSQIALRLWSFQPGEEIGPEFFRQRLARALAGRRAWLPDEPGTACRLVNAEADGLPGLIVDRYADFLVCQFLCAGTEFWRRELVALLAELQPCRGIYERSDVDVREKEGLAARTGLLWGEEPPPLVEIGEHGSRYLVDLRRGHKTGFYLDQRESRAALPRFAHGQLLNCFAYTGAFTVAALRGGRVTQATNIDSSADALALAAQNLACNGLADASVENLEGDVFQLLRRCRDSRREFDSIVLDPPKFADSREHVDGACRGYKDINLLAFKLLRPGGILATFSCSGLVSRAQFELTVAYAAQDAGREVQVLAHLEQGPDHPSSLAFTEASYLKGLVCRVA